MPLSKENYQLLFDIASKIAVETGVELVRVRLEKEQGQQKVVITIDKKEGILVEDCSKFSRQTSAELDLHDFIDFEYLLEVSSPGIYRELTDEDEFKRFLGSQIMIYFYKPFLGKKKWIGFLKSYQSGKLEVELKGKATKLNQEQIKKITLYPDF